MIIEIYKEYGIRYATEGHKHTREGWVNTACPFCTGNSGLHLGYNLNGGFFVCWRCGSHSIIDTISSLLQVPKYEAYQIVTRYQGTFFKKAVIHRSSPVLQLQPPSNLGELSKRDAIYLEKRGFDAEEIVRLWKVKSTNLSSTLHGISYKHRIYIPYIWDGREVSFDARDTTSKAQNKYMACPNSHEVIPRKSILYGRNMPYIEKGVGICVEGPTDVWRLGPLAFAVSGIKYTPFQVHQIANQFQKIAVIFDSEPQAQLQAKKLVSELKFRGVAAFNLEVKNDPGSLSNTEAKALVSKVLNKFF